MQVSVKQNGTTIPISSKYLVNVTESLAIYEIPVSTWPTVEAALVMNNFRYIIEGKTLGDHEALLMLTAVVLEHNRIITELQKKSDEDKYRRTAEMLVTKFNLDGTYYKDGQMLDVVSYVKVLLMEALG